MISDFRIRRGQVTRIELISIKVKLALVSSSIIGNVIMSSNLALHVAQRSLGIIFRNSSLIKKEKAKICPVTVSYSHLVAPGRL